jgi:hypothetical protein
MRLYAVYCIITADIDKKQNYVLSLSKDQIKLPIFEIHNARTMHNELRYNAKKMFNENTIRFIEEILVSYVDIQSDLTIKYLTEINKDGTFDLDNSIFILCGIVIEKKEGKDFHWQKYEFSENSFINPLFSIIDRTIQKSLL